jgi:hypothetical protein
MINYLMSAVGFFAMEKTTLVLTMFKRKTAKSGRKTVPVWACFSSDGPGNFFRITGRLNIVK